MQYSISHQYLSQTQEAKRHYCAIQSIHNRLEKLIKEEMSAKKDQSFALRAHLIIGCRQTHQGLLLAIMKQTSFPASLYTPWGGILYHINRPDLTYNSSFWQSVTKKLLASLSTKPIEPSWHDDLTGFADLHAIQCIDKERLPDPVPVPVKQQVFGGTICDQDVVATFDKDLGGEFHRVLSNKGN